MSDPFSARFPGTCAACGERYPTATSIRRADDADDRAEGRLVKPAPILAAVLAIVAGLLALIDTHRGPDWDDYRDQLKERL